MSLEKTPQQVAALVLERAEKIAGTADRVSDLEAALEAKGTITKKDREDARKERERR